MPYLVFGEKTTETAGLLQVMFLNCCMSQKIAVLCNPHCSFISPFNLKDGLVCSMHVRSWLNSHCDLSGSISVLFSLWNGGASFSARTISYFEAQLSSELHVGMKQYNRVYIQSGGALARDLLARVLRFFTYMALVPLNNALKQPSVCLCIWFCNCIHVYL